MDLIYSQNHFENVRWIICLVYESDALIAENDFAVMTNGQDIINAVVIVTDVGNETAVNTLVEILLMLPIYSECRLSDEQTMQAFRTHHGLNEDLSFRFCFSSEFDDRLGHGNIKIRCTEATLVIKRGVNECEIWLIIQIESSIREFSAQTTTLHFRQIHLLFCPFCYGPFLMIFVMLLGDCLM